jgi:hypothetical protein
MISNIGYRDLSDSRSSDIVRQLQQLREDVKVTGNGISEEIRQPKGNLNSPYAPDRSGPQTIKGTDLETEWRRRLDIIY